MIRLIICGKAVYRENIPNKRVFAIACFYMKCIDRWKKTLKEKVLILWRSHRSPHEIAYGVAIGVFIGIMPFYGLRIIMALSVAFILRQPNKLAIFLGLNISLPPTIPFITWAAYSIGRMMVGSSYPVFSWEDFRHFSLSSFSQFYYVLLLGSFVLGTVLSIVFYFLTLWVLSRRKPKISPKSTGN